MKITKIESFNEFMAQKEGLPDGAYDGLSNKQYHSMRKYWSSTALKDMVAASPRHFKYKYIDNYPEGIDSREFRVGSAVHCLVLEPEKFDQEFAWLGVKLDRRTKDGKAQWEEFQSANYGKTILLEDEGLTARAMANSVLTNSDIKPYLDRIYREISLFWECPFTGLKFRARPDGFGETFKIELKTSYTASPHGFTSEISKYNYDLQLRHYAIGLEQTLGLKMADEYFIVVENEAPYVSAIYPVSPEMIELGHQKWMRAAGDLELGVKQGYWMSYSEGVKTFLSPSVWEMKKWGMTNTVGVEGGI